MNWRKLPGKASEMGTFLFGAASYIGIGGATEAASAFTFGAVAMAGAAAGAAVVGLAGGWWNTNSEK